MDQEKKNEDKKQRDERGKNNPRNEAENPDGNMENE